MFCNIASIGDQSESIEMRYEDENIWLTQKMMATLYDVSVAAINQHIKKVYDDSELEKEATIKKYLIVQNEGTRQVAREVAHYNLQIFMQHHLIMIVQQVQQNNFLQRCKIKCIMPFTDILQPN